MTERFHNATETPDAELVRRCRRGEKRAFVEIVARHQAMVCGVAFAILNDFAASEDAAQEAFLNAYANLASLRHPDRFGPWILSIAHRCAVRLSKSNRHPRPLHTTPDPVSSVSPAADIEGLSNLIARLPDQERAVVLLRYVQGHDVAAIARIRGSPVGTITKQLSRAHKRLEKLYEKRELK